MLVAAGPAPPFVEDLALALGVAAFTSVVCRRFGQPAVLGYLLAGLVVGPYLPLPVFADAGRIHALSEFGVVLVMFAIGLEFSPQRLVGEIPKVGLVGLIQVSAMMWLGFVLGRALGMADGAAIFLGACVAVSSTMVVAKAVADHPIDAALGGLVFGVLVIQDLVAVILIAALTTLASGQGLEPAALAGLGARLVGFLAVLVVVGLLVVPRATRAVMRLGHAETTVVAAVGFCFALALLAARAGFSVALGAFAAGSLVAGSGDGEQIEKMVAPIRDLFAAVFFVSVGMMIDPRSLIHVWPQALAVLAVVVLGQLVVVAGAGFVGGHGLRRSLRAGLCLGQIGEFSFIIAQLGVAGGVVEPELVATIVLVAIVTATTTPVFIARSERIAAVIDRALPHRVHTVAALYESWVESLRGAGVARRGSRVRRLVRLAAIDGFAVVAIVIGSSLGGGSVVELATDMVGARVAEFVPGAIAIVLGLPFVIGAIRCVRALGTILARAALPSVASERVDMAAAPRRMLLVGIQIVAVLALALPILALTQPFLPTWIGPPVLLGLLGVVVVVFWRRADDLDGHVRAGAEAVAELLRRSAGQHEAFAAGQVEALLPGLGEITPLKLGARSVGCGRTLAEIDLRGQTGATVLAIDRPGGTRIVPKGTEPLQAGDVLALVGTHEAIAKAQALLGEAADA